MKHKPIFLSPFPPEFKFYSYPKKKVKYVIYSFFTRILLVEEPVADMKKEINSPSNVLMLDILSRKTRKFFKFSFIPA